MTGLANTIQQREDLKDRHLELHSRMIWLIEYIGEAINKVKDKELRLALWGYLRELADARSDAERIAMGPDWAIYNMEENKVEQEEIIKTINRLFYMEAQQ